MGVCFRFNSNYGSVSAGSCMQAGIVGLHCSADCLADVSNQSGWSTDTIVAEGQYETAEQCQNVCQSVPGCNFFSLNVNPGIFQGSCWLKKSISCGAPFANALGWVSKSDGLVSRAMLRSCPRKMRVTLSTATTRRRTVGSYAFSIFNTCMSETTLEH